MTILILTVGGSHQPLVTAIESLKPDRVVFLCSDDSATAKGSYGQITGEGLVLKSNPKLDKPDLPNIATLARLAPQQFEIVRIRSFDSLEECYAEARKVLDHLHVLYPDARPVADYTGGTKSMTAGLAVAAADDERCQISLVTGTRANLTAVRDGTQFARAVSVWNLRGRRRLAQIADALERFEYAAAAKDLEALASTPVSSDFQAAITAAIAQCRAFDAWDRFAHSRARDLLDPYRTQFLQHWLVLEELCCDEPRDPYLKAEDLLLNAERRTTQQRLDDAVARIYRAIEMLAQLRLKGRHGIETANVDIELVPQGLKAEFEKKRRDDGKLAIGLRDAWRLLEARGDKPLGEWFRQEQGKLMSFLEARNQSILAHGLVPVSWHDFESKGALGLQLCREAIACLKDERGNRQALQLPRALPQIVQRPEAWM